MTCFCLGLKLKSRLDEKTPPVMPFLVFRRDHLRSTSEIICGSGSYAVQFGDHLRSRIICGRRSFEVLYTDLSQVQHETLVDNATI